MTAKTSHADRFGGVRPRLPRGSRLTAAQVEKFYAEARTSRRALDLRGYDLSGVALGGERTWEFVAFGSNTDDEPAQLVGADFSAATLRGCWFTKADLHAVDFTGCEFIDCDLRFATISRSRLGQVQFRRCDMYGATLGGGTIVEGMKFALSSPPEFGEGITGLTWGCFAGASDTPALVGEDEEVYREVLRRTEFERPEGADTIDQAIDDRLLGAAGGYRRLSGFWTEMRARPTPTAAAWNGLPRNLDVSAARGSSRLRGPDCGWPISFVSLARTSRA